MRYSLTRATLWNLIGYLYLIVASFVATPILLHSLGLAQFGSYSLVIGTLTLVSACNLGLPQAVVRALSQNREVGEARRTLWATSSTSFIMTGCFAGILAIVLTLFLHLSFLTYIVIFAIALLNNVLDHYLTLPQAEGHFGYFNTKTFIVGTGNTLLAAFLAKSGQSMTTILSMQLATYLATLAPLVYFSLKFFPRPRQGTISKRVAKTLLSFGLKSQVGTLTGQVQAQYAKYLLSTLSPISLSAYIIAQGLVLKSAGGIAQLATALYPKSANQVGSPALRVLYHRLQRGLGVCALTGIGVYYMLGHIFLQWWLRDTTLVSLITTVLNILVWYLAVLVVTPLASTMLDSHGRPEITSFFAVLTTAIEITIALVLFPHYQLLAPVIAALIALVITTPMLLLVTERVMLKSKL